MNAAGGGVGGGGVGGAAAPSDWLRPAVVRPLLVLLPLLVYCPALGYGLLGLDDKLYYQQNDALRGGSWSGLAALWRATALSDYAPVSQLTLWLDLALGGGHSWWFARLHALAWMGAGTLGVHALLLRLGAGRGVAAAVALLYALHPACAQSALWLAERKNLVCLALSLWCCERYLAARSLPAGRAAVRASLSAWALGLAALFAKPHAVALPLMLAAYELTLGSGTWRARLVRLVPPALVAGAFVAVSLILIRDDLDRTHLGGSMFAAVLLDGGILARYLAHTVLPTTLAICYAVAEDPPALAAAAGCWLLLALLVALSLVPRRPRRLIAFAWLFAFAALAPALNVASQLAPMTDHYHQWALPGLLLVACLLAAEGLARLPGAAAGRAGWLATLGAALFAATLSLAHEPEFASMERLAAAAVRKQPDSAIGWSLQAYCLTIANAPAGRQAAGEAALRAFACVDAERIYGEERLLALIEGAVLLRQGGRIMEAEALADRQCARLAGGASGPLAAQARAQIALRSGRSDQAIALLAPYFTPLLAAAARELRAHCRDGAQLPDAVPPLIAGGEAITSDRIASLHEQVASQRLQWSLASAYLQGGELEKAFDVAAVLVNRFPQERPGRILLAAIYRQLGLPAAAERLAGAAP
jgi:hypothetical protein